MLDFAEASRQKVNFVKSKVFFSANTDGKVVEAICRAKEISVTKDLRRYLGVPLLHVRTSNEKIADLLEKFSKHMSDWKSKLLSLPGRITLTKAVLNSLPFYLMQTTKFQKWC